MIYNNIVSTFWKDSPSSYYWDVWSGKLTATDKCGNQKASCQGYGCPCEEPETNIAIRYDPFHRTIIFYKNNIEQGVAFKNVRSGLYPALDLWFHTGNVEILASKQPNQASYL
jgi:hypothetical protein